MATEPHVVDEAMVPPPPTLNIEVIANPNPDPSAKEKVIWDLDIREKGHANGKKIHANSPENFKLRFFLTDNTNLEVRFDAAAPIFVKDGDANPCPNFLNSSDQILVYSCEAEELVIYDWNSVVGTLRYQLNFVTKTGGPINPYDPIIDNGGGGHKPL